MGSVWSDGLSGDRSNCSIFARMARKSSVSGGELPAQVHVTNHAAAIDEEADASMSARGRRAASASRSASRGPRPNSIVLDVAAHGLDIERLGVLVGYTPITTRPRPRYSSSKRFRAGAVALQNGQLERGEGERAGKGTDLFFAVCRTPLASPLHAYAELAVDLINKPLASSELPALQGLSNEHQL